MKCTACISVLLAFSAGMSQAAVSSWSLNSGGNGHTYEIIIADTDWNEAKSAAESRTIDGTTGYLATITSAAELAFLDTLYVPRTVSEAFGFSFSGLWLGGSDEAAEGVWEWVVGPEAGQTLSSTFENWGAGEPSNGLGFSGNEDYLAGWYLTNEGSLWNDLPNSAPGEVVGYVVEYDTAVVPLPMAGVFLVSGLFGLCALRRFRRYA